MGISAVVVTYNEEKNITRCLNSLSFADEIIVVDSGSADKTTSLARKFTQKVFFKKFEGFSSVKNFGISKAKNKWVLSVDADEVITPGLRKAVSEKVNGGDKDGYYIKRDTFFLGKIIRHCGWGRDYQLRLFKKTKGKFDGAVVHEGVKVAGKTGRIEAPMLHYSYPDTEIYFIKMNRYTTLQAKQGRRKFLLPRMILAPAARFIKMYFLKLGFLDGKKGFILCCYSAVSDFVKYSKMMMNKRGTKNKTVLIRAPNWIGDAVVATALLRPLKKEFSKIFVIADKSVKGVFKENPVIGRLFTFDRKSIKDTARVIAALRKEKISAGISLTPSFSSSFIFLFSGIKKRTGFAKDGFLLNMKYRRDKKHRREHILGEFYNICLLAAPFADFYGAGQEVYVSREKEKRVLEKYGMRKIKGKKIVMAPFVKYGPAKMWPASGFEKTAKALLKGDKKAVIFIAGSKEDEKYRFIENERIVDLRGKTDIEEVFALIKNASLFIGNDSGLMHAADAFGTPLAGIFASTSAAWTGPLSKKSVVIESKVKCSPCFRQECPYGHYECMKAITPQKVIKAVRPLIKR